MQAKGQEAPRTAPSQPTGRLRNPPTGTDTGGAFNNRFKERKVTKKFRVFKQITFSVCKPAIYILWRWAASSEDKFHPFLHSTGMMPEKLWTVKSVERLLLLRHIPHVVPWGGLKPIQQLWLYANISTKNLTDALPRKCYDSFLTQFACGLLKQLYAVKLVFLIHFLHSFSKMYFIHSYTLNCKLL